MEPTTLALTLAKVIGIGIALKRGAESPEFDEADITAIKTIMEGGSGLIGMWSKRGAARPAALHLALTTRCFGVALSRHWAGSRALVPGPTYLPDALAAWANAGEHERRKELETRTRYASLSLLDPGDADNARDEFATLAAIAGPILRNPAYTSLWDAFSNPKLTAEGEESPLMLDSGAARDFERQFRLAWADAVATAEGQQVQAWRLALKDEQTATLRQILAEDLAAWGRRHVFGNIRDQPDGDLMPFMALEDVYVEPHGRIHDDDHLAPPAEPEPIQGLIVRLAKEHRIVIVKADFGHGKSLSARCYARNLAKEWLASMLPSSTNPYPVFLKCIRDVVGDYNHSMVLRRALRFHTQECIGQVEPIDSPLFDFDAAQKSMLVLDGLDEVALQPSQLREMFTVLENHTSDYCHAVVFTRPGALHEGCVPKGMPVVELLPLNEAQIRDWISKWNALPRQLAVQYSDLETADIVELARVPILLLMIALTWSDHVGGGGKLDRARLYESFFRHIARGKHEGDADDHVQIREASTRLLSRLKSPELQALRESDDEVEAMLWMMGRTAWEAHRLAYARPSQDLQQRHVDSLVVDELSLPPGDATLVKVGLLLTLQVDPAGDGGSLLFGHQSFREFLVARFWCQRLHQYATKRISREDLEESLCTARLNQPNDRAFAFLRDMLGAFEGGTRERIIDWAQETANDERLATGPKGRFRDDRRATLREAALAIGCELGTGFSIKSDAIRSMWAWFVVKGLLLKMWAPGLFGEGEEFDGLDLSGAVLQGARLSGASLRGADLVNADLSGAFLASADLSRARMVGCRLGEADLRDSRLVGALLYGSDLNNANLRGAEMSDVVLSRARCTGADLTNAVLRNARLDRVLLMGASLVGVDLRGADLRGANLGGADLENAVLRGARFGRTEQNSRHGLPEGLGYTDLRGANLRGADMVGLSFDGSTRWPDLFSEADAVAAGATRSDPVLDDAPKV